MNLDLRIPAGMMFTLLGLLLGLYGLETNGSPIYAASLGINANLWWGLVLLAFGLVMLLMGRLSANRLAKLTPVPVRAGRSEKSQGKRQG